MADLFKARHAEAQKTLVISLDDLSARIWQHLGPEKAVAMRKEGNVNRAPIGITRAGYPVVVVTEQFVNAHVPLDFTGAEGLEIAR